jgi:flagellar motor switch protein FliN/FliY
VTDALTQAAEDLQLADAVQPALQAAAESLGPCVLGPVTPTAVTDVNTRRSYDLVAMQADGQVTAWLGVLPREETGPAKSSPGKEPLNGLNLLRDVEMTLSVEIGRARMTVRDLLALSPGTVVELDRAAGAPADLLVNGRLIARGEVVVVDEDFGLRITEIVQPPSETNA